jgi:hypothetical protein
VVVNNEDPSDQNRSRLFSGKPQLHQRIALGRQPELTTGGLIRCHRGWGVVRSIRRQREHVKSDERILGILKLLKITPSAITRAAYRGETIAAANDLELVERNNP